MIGATVSHYKIVEKLGGGGMGVVYKAQDTRLDRPVALKFLSPDLTQDSQARTRFIHEAKAASALQHPNICTVHDIDETADRQLFIVMDCYDGETLKSRIASGHMEFDEAFRLVVQVLGGLSEAHGHGIIHRDIKPANIILTARGDAKIVDFGLAKLSGATRVTKSGGTLGTIAYMAPEQLQGGEVDERADIFSVGVVLYEMLAGSLPFRGDHEAALMYSIVNEDPIPLEQFRSDISPGLAEIIRRALEKNPAKRYQKAEKMIAEVRQFLSTGAEVKVPKARMGLTFSRWPVVASGGMAILVLAYLFLWPLMQDLLAGSERIPVIVMPFENKTGDPRYDSFCDVIPSALITNLENSTRLRVTTFERLSDLLKQAGKAELKPDDLALGFELCRRDSARVLVTGVITKAGEVITTRVKLLDVNDGSVLRTDSSSGEGTKSLWKSQIDMLSKQIAVGVGVPQRIASKDGRPFQEVTTTSEEAYSLFLRATKDFERMLYADALRSLGKATKLDSTFASAYRLTASTHRIVGNASLTRDAIEKAMRYAGNASRKERLWIEAGYALYVEGNRAKRLKFLMQLVEEYPKDKSVYSALAIHYRDVARQWTKAVEYCNSALTLDPSYLGALNTLGYLYLHNGYPDKAVEIFRRYAIASPGDPDPIDSMGEAYFYRGKLDSAIAKYTEVMDVRPDWRPEYHIAYLHALKEDFASAFRWINTYQSRATTDVQRIQAHWWRGLFCELTGASAKASKELAAALQLAPRLDGLPSRMDPYFVSWIEKSNALLALIRGQIEVAQRSADQYLQLAKKTRPEDSLMRTAHYEMLKALIDLRGGNIRSAEPHVAQARSLFGEMVRKEEQQTGLKRFNESSIVEEELLLAKGYVDTAIALCLKQPPLTGQDFRIGRVALPYTNWFLPRDGLARAYVQKGDLDAAIREYERITTFDPGSWDRRLIHPLHRYELAKLYEKKGSKGQAIEQYEKFLVLWKNADRDRTQLGHARARLTKLVNQP